MSMYSLPLCFLFSVSSPRITPPRGVELVKWCIAKNQSHIEVGMTLSCLVSIIKDSAHGMNQDLYGTSSGLINRALTEMYRDTATPYVLKFEFQSDSKKYEHTIQLSTFKYSTPYVSPEESGIVQVGDDRHEWFAILSEEWDCEINGPEVMQLVLVHMQEFITLAQPTMNFSFDCFGCATFGGRVKTNANGAVTVIFERIKLEPRLRHQGVFYAFVDQCFAASNNVKHVVVEQIIFQTWKDKLLQTGDGDIWKLVNVGESAKELSVQTERDAWLSWRMLAVETIQVQQLRKITKRKRCIMPTPTVPVSMPIPGRSSFLTYNSPEKRVKVEGSSV
jgi:hypothetical protein